MGPKREPGSIEELLKRAALEVGFSEAGIAELRPDRRSEELFCEWLSRGFHGEMRYLERTRETRLDPGRVLPGARSAICVLLNYFRFEPERPPGRGVFSIHATRGDYHSFVLRMLRKLEQRIRKLFPRMRSALCVDTKPVAERTLATRAGLGWIGRNNCLISTRYGSWVFLGEILTDIDLKGDHPVGGGCGDCVLCVEACPTGALLGDGLMDARRCISYLTIEKRGEIEAKFASLMGAHLFGCDICQTVCPFNGSVQPSGLVQAQPKCALVDLPLDALAEIDDRSFAELTRGSAIRRCRPEGMRRNARIALANLEEGRI